MAFRDRLDSALTALARVGECCYEALPLEYRLEELRVRDQCSTVRRPDETSVPTTGDEPVTTSRFRERELASAGGR